MVCQYRTVLLLRTCKGYMQNRLVPDIAIKLKRSSQFQKNLKNILNPGDTIDISSDIATRIVTAVNIKNATRRGVGLLFEIESNFL